jgi:His-Xaa-Ser system radical SAM maturase HxsB
MSQDTADRVLRLVFRSPASAIKIEFQGGEPLLNFGVLRSIVEKAEQQRTEGQRVEFIVATNLSPLTDEMLSFFQEHGVWISTSLDGPAFIHNANRILPRGDSHEEAVAGIARVQAILGHGAVSALMTTTRISLDYPEAIVDEYVARELSSIFLRPINPYGAAVRSLGDCAYGPDDFVNFYKRALSRIVEVNRRGYYLEECYAQILLTKILTPFPVGYVDLQSPAGAGIGVAVYNYDGAVYVSDEARMLGEMGDPAFRLGNVHEHTYEEMFGGPLLRRLVTSSCVESLVGCTDCALQTYCGANPVENYRTQGDICGHRPTSSFCRRNKAIIEHLLRLYHGSDPFIPKLFWSWIRRIPAQELVRIVPD